MPGWAGLLGRLQGLGTRGESRDRQGSQLQCTHFTTGSIMTSARKEIHKVATCGRARVAVTNQSFETEREETPETSCKKPLSQRRGSHPA